MIDIEMDKHVSSMKEVDFSGMKLSMIVIYDHPIDYPEFYVARVFEVDKPTNVVMVKNTLEEIQKDITENTYKIFMPPSKYDDPKIVGIWI